jgi:hypothetical protein
MSETRRRVRALAHESIARGDAFGWFDALYKGAAGDPRAVPWADLRPNPTLVRVANTLSAGVRSAVVVGCGLGDDAEHLAGRLEDVVAFDISPQAIAWCKERFPKSRVRYEVADVLAPPAEWQDRFDFVFEAYTLQSLPPAERRRAASAVAKLVAREGVLVVVARATDTPAALDAGPPWPLTRDEILHAGQGLDLTALIDYVDPEEPVRRFCATFTKPRETR